MEPYSPTNETASSWTDEKHVQFLNTMEASFVRAMFQENTGTLRLDRYLPDTSESTLDLQSHRRTKKHTPSDLMGPKARVDSRRIRRRRSSSQSCNSSQDQVVPQVEEGREVLGDDKVERNKVQSIAL